MPLDIEDAADNEVTSFVEAENNRTGGPPHLEHVALEPSNCPEPPHDFHSPDMGQNRRDRDGRRTDGMTRAGRGGEDHGAERERDKEEKDQGKAVQGRAVSKKLRSILTNGRPGPRT